MASMKNMRTAMSNLSMEEFVRLNLVSRIVMEPNDFIAL